MDTTGPYARAAVAYWDSGWRGVLPIGRAPAQKSPPPLAFTGHGKPDPSRADVQAWVDGPEGALNIGLRVPPGVLGLDVDGYGTKPGAETLAKLIEAHGPLPPTWATTARTDGVSGIRLYRVPLELDGVPVNWPGEAGPGIEIIQHGHRYANVWPSVNPDAGGAVYQWRVLDGRDIGLVDANGEAIALPAPGKLPPLPEAWVRGLALPYARADKAELRDDALRTWWGALRPLAPSGDACVPVASVVTQVDWARGSRHEMCRDALRALVAFGGEGHRGAREGTEALRGGFTAAVAGEQGRDAEAEFGRMLAGAVQLAAAAHQAPATRCDCESPELPAFTGPPDFTFAPAGQQAAGAGAPLVDRVAALRSRLLRPSQVKALPPPVPLVHGLLSMNTLAYLIGAPGSFKSFVALDLAGHIAGGLPWQGRKVKQGAVAYVAAEGAGGMTLRIPAWEDEYGAMSESVYMLPVPVQANDQLAWSSLVELLREVAPVMVVLDTQARLTVGMEENSNKEMGAFVEAAEGVRRATGACLLVVHHTARGGSDARGASAIDGAQDTELRLKRSTEPGSLAVELLVDKQKDGVQGISVALTLRRVERGADPLTGQDLSSLVVRAGLPFDAAPDRRPDWVRNLSEWQRRITDVMIEIHHPPLGGTKAEIFATTRERWPLASKQSLSSAFAALVKAHRVALIPDSQRWAVLHRDDKASTDIESEDWSEGGSR